MIEKFKARIVKEGNSKGVYIPYNIIKGLGLKVKDKVIIWIKKDKGD